MRRPEPGQWQPAAWPPGLVAWVPPPWQAPPASPPPPPPAAVRWAPPPGTPPHDVPQPYLLAMRSRDWAWWRPLLGLLLFAVVWFVLDVVATVAGLLGLLVAGTDVGALPDLALDQFADPWFLLLLNVSLIVAIPCVWMVWAVAHGMRIGWSSSVLGRLRRRLLLPFTRLALATLGAGIGLSVLLGFVLGGEQVTGPVPSFGWLLAVVILTTPLQSAAEEYFFRGYLSQAIAGWVRHPRAGALAAAVVSAALFSAAHVPPDVPTFLDRFAFGLAASAVVWLTGGLEAAVVLHAVNNVLVFVLAGALGEGVVTEDVPAGTGTLFLLLTLLATAAYVALVARSRGRLRPETHTEARDLRMPGPPVPAPAG